MSKRDFWIGVGCVVVGGALLASVRDRPGLMTSDVLGSSWFPRTALGCMVLMGLVLALSNLRALARPGRPSDSAAPVAGPDWRRLIAVWGTVALVAAYVAMLPAAGFVLATPIFLLGAQVFVVLVTGQALRPWTIAGVAAGATAVIYLVFTRVLGQWLPEGTWL